MTASVIAPWLLQNLIWMPTRIMLRYFGHFKISGIENLREIKRGVIFASNHVSELDPILTPASFPWFSRFLPMFYVSREKTFYNTRQILKKIFYGGIFFELWGAFETHVGLHNYAVSLKTHVKLLEHGNSLNVFPEGDKSFDGTLHEFKGGAAFLSHKTGVPIVPVAISGVYKMGWLNFFARRRVITIEFGKPIYSEELFAGKQTIEPHDYKIAMNEVVRLRISEMLNHDSKIFAVIEVKGAAITS